MNQPSPLLLQVKDLTICLLQDKKASPKKLVNAISFSIEKAKTVSLVGESGSGKTLTARAIMQLFSTPSLFISEGSVIWKDTNLLELPASQLELFRGKEIAYIPQSPMGALNPMMTVGSQLIESYKKGGASDALPVAKRLLEQCGFHSPEAVMRAYPEELSGGMRQRAVIAMALMNTPELIIADEPTTALDVSVQSEVLDLLANLVQKEHISLLFITHDLGIVARISDRVMVMKEGSIIEDRGVYSLFESPRDPYTKLLIESSTLEYV